MLTRVISLLVLLIPISGYTLDFENHLGLGINGDTFKSDLPAGQDVKNDYGLGLTLGLKSSVFWGNVGLRSGVFAEYKKVTIEDDFAAPGADDVDLTAYYASIPVNLQFNLNDRWSIFGGIIPRILLAKSCDSCGRFDDDSKILVNYTNLGIGYEMSEKFSVDVSFQQAQDDNFKDLKINTAQVLLLYRL
jgi:opacity protein-like surface antigen